MSLEEGSVADLLQRYESTPARALSVSFALIEQYEQEGSQDLADAERALLVRILIVRREFVELAQAVAAELVASHPTRTHLVLLADALDLLGSSEATMVRRRAEETPMNTREISTRSRLEQIKSR